MTTLGKGSFTMLQTILDRRQQDTRVNLALQAAGIALFTILMIVSAKLSFETGNPEVPFTMQVFVVLFSGMVLGARNGAITQVIYVMLIASGQPFDTRSLGAAALFGPTGGYLLGFIPAAFIAGYLVEKAGTRLWQRWLAGVAGIAVIYLFGASHLGLYVGLDLGNMWAVGVAPFIVYDLMKALIAAGMMEGTRSLLSLNDQSQR